jgi:DNA-binding NarL/FixJ family response regulator
MPSSLRIAPPGDGSLGPTLTHARIVLADDHPTLRRRLRELLEAEDGFVVLAELARLEEVPSSLVVLRPDVLVLDLGLCFGFCIEHIKQLRADFPATQVVATTMQKSRALAGRLIAAGAAGVVLKEWADDDLARAIRQATDGGSFVSAQVR